MLTIYTPETEFYDEIKEEFVYTKSCKLVLEHSLISISKWEAITGKRFLSELQEKTNDEIKLYIKCMTMNGPIDDMVYTTLSNKNIEEINNYINSPMTATTFSSLQSKSDSIDGYKSDNISSELIYYWMITLNIPFECQKWHINRLLTLIRVCTIKNQPAKKMSQKDTLQNFAAINAARRAKMNSKG